MSMQMYSFNNAIVNQSTQYYCYEPSNFNMKTNPIIEQMLKTNDSALEVMKIFENGSIGRLLNHEKPMHNVTWVGKQVDKLFGWGAYYVDPKDSKKRSPEDEPWDCTDDTILRGYLNASFEAENLQNKSCFRFETVQYYVELFQIRFHQFNDVICRVSNCVRERLMKCVPDCFSCQNATDEEKETTLNETVDFRYWRSKLDKNLAWAHYIAVRRQGDNWTNLNKWIDDQIVDLFNSTVNYCEEQILNEPKSPNKALYALFVIPVAVGGAIFALYKKIKANQYESIPLNP